VLNNIPKENILIYPTGGQRPAVRRKGCRVAAIFAFEE
jgi:hypothetical protein